MGKLYNLIKNFRNGDGNSFILILEKFEPQLNKFQRISKHEDMKSDLILFLFNLLNKIPFERECFKEDKYTISYISKSLRHHYIYLNKINCKISLKESVLEENYVESYDDCFNNIIFRDIIKNLTDPEKYVIIKKYKYNYSDAEIAKIKGVSRQAVHKTHTRALSKVRRFLELN